MVISLNENENDFDKFVINLLIIFGKKYLYNCKMNSVLQISHTAYAKYVISEIEVIKEIRFEHREQYLFVRNYLSVYV